MPLSAYWRCHYRPTGILAYHHWRTGDTSMAYLCTGCVSVVLRFSSPITLTLTLNLTLVLTLTQTGTCGLLNLRTIEQPPGTPTEIDQWMLTTDTRCNNWLYYLVRWCVGVLVMPLSAYRHIGLPPMPIRHRRRQYADTAFPSPVCQYSVVDTQVRWYANALSSITDG